ncbi:hypothetical protein NP233_g9944 [Leucocoprinus birnbaumii]|uniref:Ferredoxin n=1 Tax=Leucocoprinus birnbaumii TaxID=56174 RepID=A0AAD5VLU8_9AGAR|nr:hypothetical protein NP233_g9944 [Leucocoprinus birnbaumii]
MPSQLRPPSGLPRHAQLQARHLHASYGMLFILINHKRLDVHEWMSTPCTALRHGGIQRPAPGTGIKVHFKDSKGNLLKTVEANEGDDLLGVAHEYDIDLEEPDDDENDMLDMAFGLTDTSRLGCQVKLTKELDGLTATLPSATRNMFVDGKKPTKH